MKYRKKPVIVEAFQYDGDLMDGDGHWCVPEWAQKAFEDGVLAYEDFGAPAELYVKTPEGNMIVSVGDFVIQGVNGELYPCKPDIFEKTYEEVTE